MGRGQIDVKQLERPAPLRHFQLSDLALALARESELPEVGQVVADLIERYGQPELGTSRIVFDSSQGYVLKVPYSDEGLIANVRELGWCQPEIPLARYELVFSAAGPQLPLLKMERVERVLPGRFGELPDWCQRVDGIQVGYTAAGELVAFDL